MLLYAYTPYREAVHRHHIIPWPFLHSFFRNLQTFWEKEKKNTGSRIENWYWDAWFRFCPLICNACFIWFFFRAPLFPLMYLDIIFFLSPFHHCACAADQSEAREWNYARMLHVWTKVELIEMYFVCKMINKLKLLLLSLFLSLFLSVSALIFFCPSFCLLAYEFFVWSRNVEAENKNERRKECEGWKERTEKKFATHVVLSHNVPDCLIIYFFLYRIRIVYAATFQKQMYFFVCSVRWNDATKERVSFVCICVVFMLINFLNWIKGFSDSECNETFGFH